MRNLIIGGTRFLGRHLVESALDHRHEVTLFNRGKTNPDLFPHLETILGDREKDVDKLKNRIWDTVIDVAGYLPRVVRLSAEVLEANVSRYVFISSISVYENFKKIGIDESDPVGKLAEETVEEVTGETYGPLKALCEKAVQDLYRERALIIRPGLIVGPHDPTDRFTYWPVRMARGGEVLAPDRRDQPVQIIDVRDLAAFIVDLVERKITGVFNATGPEQPYRLEQFLINLCDVLNPSAQLRWVSTDI